MWVDTSHNKAEKYDCLFPGNDVLKRSRVIFQNLIGEKLLSFGGHGVFLIDEEKHHDLYDTITEFLLQ